MLPPFGEEGHSPKENAGFLDTTNHMLNTKAACKIPVTTKSHVVQVWHSANEILHVIFARVKTFSCFIECK